MLGLIEARPREERESVQYRIGPLSREPRDRSIVIDQAQSAMIRADPVRGPGAHTMVKQFPERYHAVTTMARVHLAGRFEETLSRHLG